MNRARLAKRALIVMFVLSLSLAIPASAMSADNVELAWQKTFDGLGDNRVWDIEDAGDGGFVISAISVSAYSIDATLTVSRFDNSGNQLWVTQIPHVLASDRWQVIKSSDDGYAVAGARSGDRAILIKLDSSGNILWERTVFSGIATSVVESADGGLVVCGYNNHFTVISKVTSLGEQLWEKELQLGPNMNWSYDIQQTSDGGYVVTGSMLKLSEYQNWDQMMLAKTDSESEALWYKTFGTAGIDYSMSVAETADGYIIAGESDSDFDMHIKASLTKTDTSGNLIWERRFTESLISQVGSVIVTEDGNYLLVGRFYGDEDSNNGAWATKIGTGGATIWSKTFGEFGANFAISAIASNGSYLIAGNAGSRTWVAKLSENIITNSPPIANANGPYYVDEGGAVTFDAAGSYDPDGDALKYRWDFDDDGIWDTDWLTVTEILCQQQFLDDYDISCYVKLEVTDGELTNTAGTTLTISNVVPKVGSLQALGAPSAASKVIEVMGAFTDAGIFDNHTAMWDWGDGSTSAGIVQEQDGAGSATGTHIYTTPGVYELKLTVTDKDGGSSSAVYQYIVIYDPLAGFITGSGWIDSPAGAYMPDLTLAGKAAFGFISKYRKGTTTPEGSTQFRLDMGGFSFSSTDYEWLVVAGDKAKYKGAGTINGLGDYGFMLTALDGMHDSFRIKIWDKLTNAVIYDNKMGASDIGYDATEIAGGSIVIHK